MKNLIIAGIIALTLLASCDKCNCPEEDLKENDPYSLQQFIGEWGSCSVITNTPTPIYLNIQEVYNDDGEVDPVFTAELSSEFVADSINAKLKLEWYYQDDKLTLIVGYDMHWYPETAFGNDIYSHYSIGYAFSLNSVAVDSQLGDDYIVIDLIEYAEEINWLDGSNDMRKTEFSELKLGNCGQ